MDSLAYAAMVEASQEMETWKNPPLFFPLCESVFSLPTEIDLIRTMNFPRGDQTNSLRDRIAFIDDCYFLPIEYNSWTPECRAALTKFFFHPCKVSGFSVVTTRTPKEPVVSTGMFKLTYSCNRGRVFTQSKNRKKNRKADHERADSKDDTCKFTFCVYFDPNLQRYLLPRRQGGSHTHTGHCRLDSCQVKIRKSVIDKQQMEELMRELSVNINPSTIAKLFETRTGDTLSTNQLRGYLKQAGNDLLLGNGGKSPAERLLAQLRSDPSITFVALTADVSMGNLITIRQSRRKSQKGNKKQLEEISDVADSEASDVFDCPKRFARSVLDAMKLRNGQKLLLCVAWMSDEGGRMFRQFPQSVGTDITNGTNAEKRPLLRATARDANNQIIPFFNAFVCSGSRWVHSWIFEDVFPTLFPPVVLSQVRMMLTDEDPHCFQAFDTSVKKGIFRNAKHRLCKWHKVNRNFTIKVGSTARKDNLKDKNFVNLMRDWFYTFTEDIETEEEEKVSLRCLDAYIKTCPGINEPLRVFTTTFVEKSFKKQMERICFRHYKYTPQGDLGINSFSESSNSALKRSDCGPKPQHNLDRSQKAIQEHEKDMLKRKWKEQRRGLYKTRTADVLPSQESHSECPSSGDEAALRELEESDSHTLIMRDLQDLHNKLVNNAKVRLSKLLVDYALDDAIQQEEASKNFLYLRESENRFLVRRQFAATRQNPAIPTFDRTRVVEVMQFGDSCHIVCSCGHFQRVGRVCRHIRCVMSVNGRQLGPEDFGVRNTKLYAAHYGVDCKFTEAANDLLMMEGPGPSVSLPIVLNELTWYGNFMNDYDTAKQWFHDASLSPTMCLGCTAVDPDQPVGMFEKETNALPHDNEPSFGYESPAKSCHVSPTKYLSPSSTFTEYHPLYVTMADSVKDRTGMSLVLEGLYGIIRKLNEHNAESNPDNSSTVVSLPKTQRSRVDKRITNSPARKKKKSNTRPSPKMLPLPSLEDVFHDTDIQRKAVSNSV